MEEKPCICCCCPRCHVSPADSLRRTAAPLKVRVPGCACVRLCVFVSVCECVSVWVCALTLTCVYKHGKGPLGTVHRALSIWERVSKMMTGHVALGWPANAVPSQLRTALCALTLSQNKVSLTPRCWTFHCSQTQTDKINIINIVQYRIWIQS